jgi:hypothetical protein
MSLASEAAVGPEVPTGRFWAAKGGRPRGRRFDSLGVSTDLERPNARFVASTLFYHHERRGK